MGNFRGGPVTREVQISKKLSWLLRHGAEKEGLTLNNAGYASLDDVLANRNVKSFKINIAEVKAIVAADNKQRFSLMRVNEANETMTENAESNDAKDYIIRANQGHSIKVESEHLLEPLNQTNMPSMCVHGTTASAWPKIVSSGGLRPMTRQHIHFATGLPSVWKTPSSSDKPETDDVEANASTAEVISGMRNTSKILIHVDLPKAMADGIKFWKSENGVILTEGDATGFLPLQYLQKVEERTKKQRVLLLDGQLVNDGERPRENTETTTKNTLKNVDAEEHENI